MFFTSFKVLFMHYIASNHFLTQSFWRLTFFIRLYQFIWPSLKDFLHFYKLLNFKYCKSYFLMLNFIYHTHFMMYSEIYSYRLLNPSDKSPVWSDWFDEWGHHIKILKVSLTNSFLIKLSNPNPFQFKSHFLSHFNFIS